MISSLTLWDEYQRHWKWNFQLDKRKVDAQYYCVTQTSLTKHADPAVKAWPLALETWSRGEYTIHIDVSLIMYW